MRIRSDSSKTLSDCISSAVLFISCCCFKEGGGGGGGKKKTKTLLMLKPKKQWWSNGIAGAQHQHHHQKDFFEDFFQKGCFINNVEEEKISAFVDVYVDVEGLIKSSIAILVLLLCMVKDIQ